MAIEKESVSNVTGSNELISSKSTNDAIAFEKLSGEHPFVPPSSSVLSSSETQIAQASGSPLPIPHRLLKHEDHKSGTSSETPLPIPPRLLEHKEGSITKPNTNTVTSGDVDDMSRYIAVMGGDNAGIPITPKDMEDPEVRKAALLALGISVTAPAAAAGASLGIAAIAETATTVATLELAAEAESPGAIRLAELGEQQLPRTIEQAHVRVYEQLVRYTARNFMNEAGIELNAALDRLEGVVGGSTARTLHQALNEIKLGKTFWRGDVDYLKELGKLEKETREAGAITQNLAIQKLEEATEGFERTAQEFGAGKFGAREVDQFERIWEKEEWTPLSLDAKREIATRVGKEIAEDAQKMVQYARSVAAKYAQEGGLRGWARTTGQQILEWFPGL